jgi:hypothetical protein
MTFSNQQFSSEQITEITQPLREQLGDNITWQFEERLSVMLSEFAQNKSAAILTILQTFFPHQWDVKSVKKLPTELKEQLAELAKLTKEQMLFTIPATDETPAMAAFLWPWGHGGTYSLRIKLLTDNYHFDQQALAQQGLLSKLKKLFS